MSKTPKSTLSKKALRNAAPTETKPYLLHRKYDDPVNCDSADVKRIIKRDLSEHQDMIARIGRPADLEALAGAQKALADWDGGDLSIEYVVDSYTGTRYSIEVKVR